MIPVTCPYRKIHSDLCSVAPGPCLCGGRDVDKQIAIELGTVEKTIKVHRARVMEKMQAQSLAELVRMMERAN